MEPRICNGDEFTCTFVLTNNVCGPCPGTLVASDIFIPFANVTDNAVFEFISSSLTFDHSSTIAAGGTFSFTITWKYHADQLTDVDVDEDCCIVGLGVGWQGTFQPDGEMDGGEVYCGELVTESPSEQISVINGITHVTSPKQVIFFPLEDCPCDCTVEEDPCDCDGIDWFIWGQQQHRLSSHPADPFSGSLWYFERVDQGVVYPPYTDVNGTHYPFELGNHDEPPSSRRVSSQQFELICDPSGPTQIIYESLVAQSPTPQYVNAFDVVGAPSPPSTLASSFECSPDHWFMIGLDYNPAISTGTWGSRLISTRSNRLHVPDPAVPPIDCCNPSASQHPCPPVMRMSAGGWVMDSLIRSSQGAIIYSFIALSNEDQAWTPPSTISSLASGLALLPGWGPSTVPNIRGNDPSNQGEIAQISCSLTMAPFMGGWRVTANISFLQRIIIPPTNIPNQTYTTRWWYRTNPPVSFNIPSGQDPCSIFPLTIQVPGDVRTTQPGGPILISSLTPLPVTFSFIN